MRCNRCGNEEEQYFYQDEGVWYCRKCVMYGRLNVGECVKPSTYQCKRHRCQYKLDYPLTASQLEASRQVLEMVKCKQDVLLYAACGGGKTEIVMDSIQYALNKGLKVGFAISRRQVVLEIWERMQRAFKKLKVIPVCEGYTSVVDGDLIVCTMHQLYRYHQTFDVLIMDEVDAFPYKHNALLEQIAMNAVKGSIIYLTATPDEAMIHKVNTKQWAMVTLFQRPHGYPLVVPKLWKLPIMFQKLALIKWIEHCRRHGKQMLVFVPTIDIAKRLFLYMKLWYPCGILTSKTEDKEVVIKKMRSKDLLFLITTTILERGVTFSDIQVIVLQADHPVFDEASLIQIIGRVGRSVHFPTGEGVFLYRHKSNTIKRCVEAIQKMNENK